MYLFALRNIFMVPRQTGNLNAANYLCTPRSKL